MKGRKVSKPGALSRSDCYKPKRPVGPAREEGGRGDKTYGLLVLAKGGMDHAHVEEDFGGVRDLVELAQGVLELVVVVAAQGRDPGFYFLLREASCGEQRGQRRPGKAKGGVAGTNLLERHGAKSIARQFLRESVSSRRL